MQEMLVGRKKIKYGCFRYHNKHHKKAEMLEDLLTSLTKTERESIRAQIALIVKQNIL